MSFLQVEFIITGIQIILIAIHLGLLARTRFKAELANIAKKEQDLKKEITDQFKELQQSQTLKLERLTDYIVRYKPYFETNTETISDLRAVIQSLQKSQEQAHSTIDEMKKSHKNLVQEISSETISYFDFTSILDRDFEKVPATRYLHVEIYIDTNNRQEIQKFENSYNAFIEGLNFISEYEVFKRDGSWWKKLFAKSKDFVTSSEVQEKLQQAEHALRLKHIDEVQSNVDKNQAEGIAALLKASENIQNVAFRVGSLVAIKTVDNEGNPMTFGTTLTSNEMIHLQKNPSLIRNPKKLMAFLNGDIKEIE